MTKIKILHIIIADQKKADFYLCPIIRMRNVLYFIRK